MSLKRPTIIVTIVAFSVILTYAKGAFTTVKITNTATGDVIEVDRFSNEQLSDFFLFDYCASQSVNHLPELGEGYEIQRGMVHQGTFEPFDMLVYYPDSEGGRGYIHYIGLVNARGVKDGSSEYDNRWFAASLDTEPYLRELLFEESAVESPFRQALIATLRHRC